MIQMSIVILQLINLELKKNHLNILEAKRILTIKQEKLKHEFILNMNFCICANVFQLINIILVNDYLLVIICNKYSPNIALFPNLNIKNTIILP